MTILGKTSMSQMADDQLQRLIEQTPSHTGKACIDFKIIEPLCCSPAPLLGGYSVSAPPDPIPNSAVKPDCADGTIT